MTSTVITQNLSLVPDLTLGSDPIVITPLDLISPLATSSIDLVAKEFDAVPGVFPNPATAGGTTRINFKVQNSGFISSGTFKVGFYISKIGDQTDKIFLDSRTFTNLNALTISDLNTIDIKLPDAGNAFWNGDTGYYIGMSIDTGNEVIESNELNNIFVGREIDYDVINVTGTQRLSNLTGTLFDVKPEPLNAGSKFNFDFTIANLGGATNAPIEVAFYLSKDKNISSIDDKFIVRTTLAALSANSNTGVMFMVNDLILPGTDDSYWNGDGTYYVGMIIDPDNKIAESNEFDNRNMGLALDYDDVIINKTQSANLRAKSFDVTPEPLKAGSKFNFDFDIENLGGSSTGAFKASFYLSADRNITSSDKLLITTTIDDLKGKSSTGIRKMIDDLILPGINDSFWTGDGTYYVGMVVDSSNVITESNELDNSNRGLTIDIDEVVISGTKLLGTRVNDDMLGTDGGDFFFGKRGDDDIFGFGGNDDLSGERGDDNLYGGLGNDFVFGNEGDDFLWGVEVSSKQPGAGEIDTLTGGFGADTFFLGSDTQTFYLDVAVAGPTNPGYAILTDFTTTEDTIVLNGSAGNYSLRATTGGLPNGQGIYRNNDLIAIVQGNASLSLSAGYFQYQSA